MRRILRIGSGLLVITMLFGCSQSGAPNGALPTGPMQLAKGKFVVRAASASRRTSPHVNRITTEFLYTQAVSHVHEEMLRPDGAPKAPFDQRRHRAKRNGQRSGSVAVLNYKLLRRVPMPKRYKDSRRRHYSDNSGDAAEVDIIAMGRFSSSDCWLYPYVFAMQYDAGTGALLQESVALAPSGVASANGMPEELQVC